MSVTVARGIVSSVSFVTPCILPQGITNRAGSDDPLPATLSYRLTQPPSAELDQLKLRIPSRLNVKTAELG